MKQASRILTLQTRGPGMYDFTRDIRVFCRETNAVEGVLTLMCRHTSASLTIQENADPDVRHDLDTFLHDLVPDGDPRFVHDAEGPDDMPAHVKAALTATSIGIPLMNGRLALGTWQGIFLWEHRHAPHEREVVIQISGS